MKLLKLCTLIRSIVIIVIAFLNILYIFQLRRFPSNTGTSFLENCTFLDVKGNARHLNVYVANHHLCNCKIHAEFNFYLSDFLKYPWILLPEICRRQSCLPILIIQFLTRRWWGQSRLWSTVQYSLMTRHYPFYLKCKKSI